MELYKKAGAKYFVSMGSHHDDFFLWNSKLHRWNSVEMGPHRDVVGDWQKAAKKNGLYFGVSEHLGPSYLWFQTSHGKDRTGPLAGVPYDGSDTNFWDLYHPPTREGGMSYTKDQRFQQLWYDEIEELVDNYKPDLLYTDGGVAFGNVVGLSQIANFYNVKMRHGKTEAVYTCKQNSGGRWVHDYERGVNAGIDPNPWQTDTSIGDWFYNKNWKYRPVSWTVHMLVDIVSKNGNLLLNVVQRPDGTLDPEVETMLHQLADWTAMNGEAIYGTRPWLVYGEGSTRARGGNFREDMKYTAEDIRFTTKGKKLYAIALGWPDSGKVIIKSLATTSDATQNKIDRVELLGHKGILKFTQTVEGLAVDLPDVKLSDLTCALRITGSNLKPAPEKTVPPDNVRMELNATNATLHGTKLQLEEKGGKPDIGYWDDPAEWISWQAHFASPRTYRVSAIVSAADGDCPFVISLGGNDLFASIKKTSSWEEYSEIAPGTIEVIQSGDLTISVRPKDASSWKPINFNSLRLEPVLSGR